VVQASEILAKIKRGEAVRYDGVIIEGDLDLSELDLPIKHVERTWEDINDGLTEAVKLVESSILIKDSEIRGDVNLRNIVFQNKSSFNGATLTKKGQFSGAIFSGVVAFKETIFIGDADFEGAKFSGDANFEGAKFASEADFVTAKFNGETKFREVQFCGKAYFSLSQFSGKDKTSKSANFRRAKFCEAADFTGSQFLNEADFWGTEFVGDAEFILAKFCSDSFFWAAKFKGLADFSSARFDAVAAFDGTEFSSIADFRLAKFGGDVSFINSNFHGNVNFGVANFSEMCIVEWANIKNHIEKSDSTIYPVLIKTYKDLSRFEDADDCYYQYRKIRRTSESLKTKIPDIAAQVSHGYWVKPMYAIGWSIFFIFIFGLTFLYINGDSITKYSTQEILEDSNMSNSTTLIKTGKIGLIERPVFLFDYFLFSMETFTSGLTSFLYPSTEFKASGICKNIAVAENLLGTLLIAFFFYAYGKTIRRG